MCFFITFGRDKGEKRHAHQRLCSAQQQINTAMTAELHSQKPHSALLRPREHRAGQHVHTVGRSVHLREPTFRAGIILRTHEENMRLASHGRGKGGASATIVGPNTDTSTPVSERLIGQNTTTRRGGTVKHTVNKTTSYMCSMS